MNTPAVLPMVSGGTALLDAGSIIRLAAIQPGWEVADFGCGGNGHFTFPLATAVGAMGRVYAVDIRSDLLGRIQQHARQHGQYQIQPRQANVEVPESTGIAAAQVSAVFIINVLFQNAHPEKIIAEARRITKPDGVVVVVDWNGTGSLFGPPLNRRLGLERVQAMAEAQGLRLERSFNAGPSHYALFFKV